MTRHERQLQDRVDGSNVEPGDGLHADIAGVRALLCDALRKPVPGACPGIRTSRGSTCNCALSACASRSNGRSRAASSSTPCPISSHDEVPEAYIRQVFDVMEEAGQHTFQVLTKRAERARQLAPSLPWPSNVWLGVSVENKYWTRRIDDLREVPAAVRFLSCEPLLGPLHDLDLTGVHWVIAGGESGPRCAASETGVVPVPSATSAPRRRSTSSSSSGARSTLTAGASGRRRRAGSWMGRCGMGCQRGWRYRTSSGVLGYVKKLRTDALGEGVI